MAVFRRSTPIDPMHEREICLGLAEHHEGRARETEGEESADHEQAARACRARAAEWEAKVAAQVEPQPCKPTAVASHQPAAVQAKPAAKPKPKPATAPKPAGGLL